ncbi:MAG TPA: hypothetical protein VF698_07135 [Thermoanaerobaculia bacterium]|jgi:hypothetical protein
MLRAFLVQAIGFALMQAASLAMTTMSAAETTLNTTRTGSETCAPRTRTTSERSSVAMPGPRPPTTAVNARIVVNAYNGASLNMSA